MKIFFDTSVLVAVAVAHHPHHVSAFAVFRQASNGRKTGVVTAHALAETYSTLTRLPLNPMIHPTEALRFIKDSVLGHCEVVSLHERDYVALLASAASAGIRGGAFYDTLQLHGAEKAGCDRIYTFSVNDFVRLAPQLQARIVRP